MSQPQLDEFSLRFLRTALAIDRHFPGYVDAYYGPRELKAQAEVAEPLPAAELLDAIRKLQTLVPTDDAARHRYLQATLRAMACSVRLIAGEAIEYLDEVEQIYDIKPALVAEDAFQSAHRELDLVLPVGVAGESLAQRLANHRRLFEVEAEKALALIDLARSETRVRTAQFIELPPDESVEVKLASNQPWGAYNWYLGNGRSLIEFNTDIPLSSVGLIGTFAHEGYPGHHTEAILKERALYRDRGYAEQSVMILHSPAAVIAEGIATTALEIIFPAASHHDWNREVMLPAAALDGRATEAAEQLQTVTEAMKQLRWVTPNAAILYHTGALTREQTIDYLQTYGLTTPVRAEKSFSFLSHPLYRSYIFTYTQGYELLAKAADRPATFRRLLTEQILPSELALAN